MTTVTREELVERARKLAPLVAERAPQCEERRCLPEQTFQAFVEAGLLKAFVPREFGGYALDFPTVIETSREVARGCGSSGWCLAIATLHNRVVANFPRAAQQEVFGRTPESVVCGVFMPNGIAVPVDGGYRLTGEWNFASASDHSSHAILAGLIRPDPDGLPTGAGSFLVRREDFTIDDNWFVAGLAGTGSKKAVVEDVFVPSDWVLPFGGGDSETSPFQFSLGDSERVPEEGALRNLPMGSTATLGLTGVAIGVAYAALDNFRERLATKLRLGAMRSSEHNVAAHLRLAESAAEVDAVELMVLRDCEEMETTAAAGRLATPEQRGRYRRDAAYAFQVSARAVARLLPAAGAHSIYNDGILQRCLRDTQVMATHVVADWDQSRESYARSLLDLPVEDPAY